MRIIETGRIATGSIQKQETFLEKEVKKQTRPTEQKDTMNFGISAKEMNQWFNEARDLMINRVSKFHEAKTPVSGVDVAAKVLGEMERDGKRNENI